MFALYIRLWKTVSWKYYNYQVPARYTAYGDGVTGAQSLHGGSPVWPELVTALAVGMKLRFDARLIHIQVQLS